MCKDFGIIETFSGVGALFEIFVYFSWHLSKVSGWLFGSSHFMAYQPLLVIERQIHFYENSSISNNSV